MEIGLALEIGWGLLYHHVEEEITVLFHRKENPGFFFAPSGQQVGGKIKRKFPNRANALQLVASNQQLSPLLNLPPSGFIHHQDLFLQMIGIGFGEMLVGMKAHPSSYIIYLLRSFLPFPPVGGDFHKVIIQLIGGKDIDEEFH
jgi:hypothetical protein